VTPTVAASPPAPTPPQERIELLDVLRGFALFGVLVMNMQYFVSPTYASILQSDAATTGDWLGFWFVRMFAESKFYPLFSFLFGYGMAIQIQNAQARDSRFVPLYTWRLTILLLIGAVHSIYFWSGDILATYALLGFVLLLFHRRSDATLLVCSLLCLFAVSGGLSLIHSGWLPADWSQRPNGLFDEIREDDRRAYQQAIRVMSMFLIGLLAGRKRVLTDGIRDASRVARICIGCWIAGLTGNLVYTWLVHGLDPNALSWSRIVALSTLAWSGPVLAAAYVTTLIGWTRKPRWRTFFHPLSFVGKMALTNYLLQTLICQGLLSHSMLGRFGPVHPPLGLLLTIVVFAFQIATSRWWLLRYRFGPMEWLWRTLTYGQMQPMRRLAA
jgi:uncharacterized protein